MSYRHPKQEDIVIIKGAHFDDSGFATVRTSDSKTQELLDEALIDLKIANLHLAVATDEKYTEEDIEHSTEE